MIMPHRLAQLAALPVWARRSKDRRPPSCSRLGKTAIIYALLRPLLFRIDAETAHHWTLAALKRAHALRLVRDAHVAPSPRRVMGLDFTNAGVDTLLTNVGNARYRGVLGINIGKNFDTPVERAADDYVIGLRKVYEAASYVAVNISSPNTPNLRDLQRHDALSALLSRLKREQRALAERHDKYVPLAVKIAPDLNAEAVAEVATVIREEGIDAVIATNTTLSREAVAGLPHADEAGGLSGAPLMQRATEVVRQLKAALGETANNFVVGGFFCGF